MSDDDTTVASVRCEYCGAKYSRASLTPVTLPGGTLTLCPACVPDDDGPYEEVEA